MRRRSSSVEPLRSTVTGAWAFLAVLAAATGSIGHAQTPAGAACSGPQWRQLDFWVGDWIAEWDAGGRVERGRNKVSRDEFGRCVIYERFTSDDGSLKGMSISTYHPATRDWRQTWVDDQGGYFALAGGPVTGEPHSFELRNFKATPESLELRMIWQDVRPDRFVWRWQRRDPGGAWVDRWVIRYRRAAPA
jgi:hypothetical protein